MGEYLQIDSGLSNDSDLRRGADLSQKTFHHEDHEGHEGSDDSNSELRALRVLRGENDLSERPPLGGAFLESPPTMVYVLKRN
jgi:hypothetical protein